MLSLNEVRKMNLVQLLEYPEFRNHYILMYNQCHKSVDGAIHFDRETTYLKKMAIDNKKIMQATALSVMTALLDLAYHGLSIEPIAKPLAYITVRGHNLGTKENPQWEQRAILNITGYGEVTLRIRSGIIRYVDNPVLVFSDDEFEVNKGKVTTHIPANHSKTITHAYLRIVRYDGSEDYKILSMDDLQAMRKKSDSPDGAPWIGGEKADDGTKQPMAGMIFAKLFRHSFAGYPRLNLGKNTELANEDLEREAVYASVMGQITNATGEPNESNWEATDVEKRAADRVESMNQDDDNPLGDTPAPPVETKSPPPAATKEKPKETPKEKAAPPVQNNGQGVLPSPEEIPTYEF